VANASSFMAEVVLPMLHASIPSSFYVWRHLEVGIYHSLLVGFLYAPSGVQLCNSDLVKDQTGEEESKFWSHMYFVYFRLYIYIEIVCWW